MKSKGKEVAGKGSSEKRMREDSDKTGRRKKRNRSVLQFVDDAAYEVDENEESEDSIFDDDFFEDEFWAEVKVKKEPGKAPEVPVFPKEEELSEEELDKMLQERYKPGSSFVTYAEDRYNSNRSMERNAFVPLRDPIIWKVKCMVGRERHSAFCLMQKFIDLQSLGNKLQIVSAFALDHVKGFIYIEADKQNDVNEACKGICSIYSSRMASVPKNEVSHLMSIRSKYNEVSRGTWARVKNGKYKGDLAQVMAVNHARKNATVKLIPRIDFQVLGEKFGSGVKSKKTAIPAPRLICSSELEEFRPLIQSRRDRETGEFVEVLDGMMLKDGYLYKKIALDSLNCWGVMPSEEELLKFEFSKKEESGDLEWLSQLYGEEKKEKCTPVKCDKGGGKGEGSSSSGMANSFDVHDLVFFRRKDFGVIVGTEKDHSFKILKEGSEGPVVVTVDQHELKNASFDKKLTALDQRKKTILINDTVRVAGGPLEGKQGIVKKIYRGTIFLYDENEQENGGYFCSRSQICEKIKLSDDGCNGKDGKTGPLDFEDFPSSPKSPLSPKKPWQPTENDNRNFNQGDRDGMFSVGQSLRIRVGPLKGYLCRVLAVRRSDVTVKLDSQQKVLTVKSEHLAEVKGKSSAIPIGEAAESVKPFDLLGIQDGSRDLADGVGTSADGERWGAGGLSSERSAWPAFPSSSFSLQPESGAVQNEPKTDAADGAWGMKPASNKNSSWGTAVADENTASNTEQVGGWNKAVASGGFGGGSSENWGKPKISSGGDQSGPSKDTGDVWGKAKPETEPPGDSSWDKGKNVIGSSASGWNNASGGTNTTDSWGKGKDGEIGGSAWGKSASLDKGTSDETQVGSWGKAASVAAPGNQTGSWGNMVHSSDQVEAKASGGWTKAADGSGGQNENWGNPKKSGETEQGKGGSTWGKAAETQDRDDTGSWGKAAEKWSTKDASGGSKAVWGSSATATQNKSGGWSNAGGSLEPPKPEATGWKKQDGGSSWGKEGGGGSWSKQQTGGDDQNSSWGTPKSSGGGRGFGGWNTGGFGKDDSEYDGGRGSGGRRGGRGGGRGDRDQFGGGRSFGRGRSSSDWSKDGEGKYGSGGLSGGWGRGNNAFDGGWNKSNVSGDDSDWKSGTSGSGGGNWNASKPSDGDQSQAGGWNTGKETGEKSGANDWGSKSSGQAGGVDDQKGGWNKRKGADEIQNSTWGTKTNDTDTNLSSGSGWGTQKGTQDKSSGWNQKSTENEKDGGSNDQQDGWKSRKTSDGGSATGWGQNSKWNSGAGDTAGGNQNSGWGSKSNWSSGNAFGGSENSNEGGDKKPSWGNKGNWSSGNDFGGSENKTDSFGGRGRGGNWRGGRGGSDRRGFGGRGGLDTGGFGGGRWSSERGGFEGRGRSDRGGFRGRGSSDRGGFGGRGRGRRDDSVEPKSYDWNKGSDNDNSGGWKSSGGDSWNQSGDDKGQGQNWSSGWNPPKGAERNEGASDQAAGGWNKGSDNNSSGGWKSTGGGSWNQAGADKGQGQSWNPPKGAEQNEGASDKAAGGWNKGSDNNSSGSWKSTGGGNWNQSSGDKGQGSKGAEGNGGASGQATGGWNKGSDSIKNTGGSEAGGWNNGGSSWNKESGAPNEGASRSSSGWKQPTEAKGSEVGGPTDAWGKAAGSWGKGNEGGSKGGW